MINQSEELITIQLYGHPMDDGRTHVKGDDLPGFHFILDDGEDPREEMFPTLVRFLEIFLRANAYKQESVQVREVAHVTPMRDLPQRGSPFKQRSPDRDFNLVAALG